MLHGRRVDSYHVEARHGKPIAEGSSNPAAFTVLALGKLGGCELNYSSDIDVIFVGERGACLSGRQSSADDASKSYLA